MAQGTEGRGRGGSIQRSRRREWAARLGLLAGSFLVTALCAEVALRILGVGAPVQTAEVESDGFDFFTHHEVLGWDLVPGAVDRHSTDEFDIDIRISPQGLRADRTYAPIAPEGVRRAVVLGDSFTFGHGVEVGEIWSAGVERALSAAESGDVELVNLAVTGYGVDQMVLRLEDRSTESGLAFEGLAFGPDVVIAALFVADVFRVVEDDYQGYRKPRFVLDTGALRLTGVPVADAPPEARGGSRLVGLVARRAVPLAQHLGWGDSWPITGALLERLRQRVEGAGARLVVVVLPKDRGVLGSGPRHQVNVAAAERLTALVSDLGIPCLDLTTALSAHLDEGGDDEPLYYASDGHWTRAGHRVAAQAIAPWLAQHLPPPRGPVPKHDE